jgi:hypothetical protein
MVCLAGPVVTTWPSLQLHTEASKCWVMLCSRTQQLGAVNAHQVCLAISLPTRVFDVTLHCADLAAACCIQQGSVSHAPENPLWPADMHVHL